MKDINSLKQFIKEEVIKIHKKNILKENTFYNFKEAEDSCKRGHVVIDNIMFLVEFEEIEWNDMTNQLLHLIPVEAEDCVYFDIIAEDPEEKIDVHLTNDTKRIELKCDEIARAYMAIHAEYGKGFNFIKNC